MYHWSIDGAQVQLGDTPIAVEIDRRVVVGIADALAAWLIHIRKVHGVPFTIRTDGDLEAGGEAKPVAVVRELKVEQIIICRRQPDIVTLADEVEADFHPSAARL